MRPLTLVALLCLALSAHALNAHGRSLDSEQALLRGLDKVTARIKEIVVPTNGNPVRFGDLNLKVLACKRSKPEDVPEHAAFLQITDDLQENVLIFSGWMFASSPAINVLEHPIYDVWVIECFDE